MKKYQILIELLKQANVKEIPKGYGVSTEPLQDSYNAEEVIINGQHVFVSKSRNYKSRKKILENFGIDTFENILAIK